MVRWKPLGKKKGTAPLGEKAVPENDAGQRLDRWLKGIFPNLPYIAVQKLVRQGKVRVDGVKAEAATRLNGGAVVTFPADFAEGERRAQTGDGPAYQVTSDDMVMLEAATLYEDGAMLVLNKPAGLPAQAGGGQVRSLDRIFEGIFGAEKAPKLVHRIDRETTGLLVCAKNRTMAHALTEAFAGREIQKEYLAVVVGTLPAERGDIREPIAKVGPFAKVAPHGDKAHSSWRLLASDGQMHLVACVPHTGRMNQLRVHMDYIGLPMLGDDKYGNDALKMAGKAVHPTGKIPLYLHAWKLQLAHPKTGEPMAFEAPLPAHFAAMAERMKWQG